MEGSFGGLFWTFDEVSPEFQKEGGSGFPIEGGANRPGWAPTYDSTKFSKNCMKLRNLWAVGGAHRGRPLRSASAQVPLSYSTCRNLSST